MQSNHVGNFTGVVLGFILAVIVLLNFGIIKHEDYKAEEIEVSSIYSERCVVTINGGLYDLTDFDKYLENYTCGEDITGLIHNNSLDLQTFAPYKIK